MFSTSGASFIPNALGIGYESLSRAQMEDQQTLKTESCLVQVLSKKKKVRRKRNR